MKEMVQKMGRNKEVRIVVGRLEKDLRLPFRNIESPAHVTLGKCLSK